MVSLSGMVTIGKRVRATMVLPVSVRNVQKMPCIGALSVTKDMSSEKTRVI